MIWTDLVQFIPTLPNVEKVFVLGYRK